MVSSRVKNIAVVLVLALFYIIPALFLPYERMLDLVSFLMLVFGIIGIGLILEESWGAFWSGDRDRSALALYGLFALFISVVVMRTYGILTRNVEGAAWLTETYMYSVLVYIQLIGLWLFSRASTPPTVSPKRSRWGQLIIGVVIGAIVASSKALEPILMAVGRLWSRLF